ncbi:MAG: alpha/beta hydrolase [Clostridia bacterium]|nr:alpha/beta hydrolase [Clostridia bacterium]
MKLYETYPAEWEEIPEITAYIPAEKKCNGAVVIFPGGAYRGRAAHEGKGYAEFLQSKGICAFDVAYRVSPHRFPLELLDARRAVRWVRAHAEEYGIDKNKIAVMGSSAGGHLAAMVSTYIDPIEFEGLDSVDAEDYLPNAQILCYPVIGNPTDCWFAHKGSYLNLLGSTDADARMKVDPLLNANRTTPQAFIWHTAADVGVNMENSLRYASVLHRFEIPVELHIFPDGGHGLGLAEKLPHTAQWSGLLVHWLYKIFA